MTKVCTLTEAVHTLVRDGDTVVLGTGLEHAIPFATGHEIIRQRKRNLTLVGPISDILFDQLIGGGCVKKVEAAWIGNVAGGSAYNFRRAVESGAIEMVDHSNLTVALRLQAAAWGVPFLPTRTALGSDLMDNPSLKSMRCPFTNELLVAVAALSPDVAIIHAQRADANGNAYCLGNLGITTQAVGASRRVLLTVEEIVEPEIICERPELVAFSGTCVTAVVKVPFGAHPSPLVGYYHRDDAYFLDYHARSKTPQEFEKWLAEWVSHLPDRAQYLSKIKIEKLRL